MIVCYCDAGGNNTEGKDFYGSYKVNGELIDERCSLRSVHTVNEAEYEIMIRLLSYLWYTGIADDVTIYSDSKIVVNQMNNLWKINAPNLEQYWLEAQGFLQSVIKNNPQYTVQIIWTPRATMVKELGH